MVNKQESESPKAQEGKTMKSKYNIPMQYRQEVEKRIQAEVNEYLNKKVKEFAMRFCYASVIALHDLYRNRFGKKKETLNHNYQRFVTYMQYLVLDAVNESYTWTDSTDPEAVSKALAKELQDRGIEVDFE